MDSNLLIQAFMASIGADNSARLDAYNFLKAITFQQGLIQQLLEITFAHQALEIRQMAVIHLKNLVKQWTDAQLNAGDKEFLKSHLIGCLQIGLPEKIRSQFEEIAHFVLKHEYPWPEYFVQVDEALSSPDKLYSGLLMIYHAAKPYEFVMTEKREKLITLVDRYFDRLAEILESLVQIGNEAAYKHINILLMAYWSAFYLEIPANHADNQRLGRWLKAFKDILMVPYEGNEEEMKSNESSQLWLCKKHAIQNVHRIFTRYFNKHYLRDQNLQVCEYFQSVWANEFFLLILKSIFNQKTCMTDSVMNFYLKYLNQATKFEPTFKIMTQELVGKILVYVCLPLLFRTKDDEDTWNEDPIEFIKREEETSKNYYSKKTSSVNLMTSLCEKRFLLAFFNYIKRELNDQTEIRKKEAMLFALGSLSDLIKQHPVVKNEIHELLFKYVYPDFSSSVNLLRFRAPWVYSRFAQIPFPNEQVEDLVFKSLCKLMIDEQLPVRYAAAVALPRILHWESSKSNLKSEIENLLRLYLKLINEVDSEEVIESLEVIVSTFPEEIKPFAIAITQHLISNFENSLEKPAKDEKEDSSNASIPMLNAIAKVIDSCLRTPAELLDISLRLLGVLKVCFRSADYFEEGINILTSLLHMAPEESLPHLYDLLSYILDGLIGSESTKSFASQFIEEIFPPIGNFIMKYKAKTLENFDKLVHTALHLLKESEDEIFLSCQILIALLENHNGPLIDQLIPVIITKSFECFNQDLSKKYKIACSQVIFVSLWNNPSVATSCAGIICSLIEYAADSVKCYIESFAKVHLIFGLGSLFIVPLPPDLAQMLFRAFQVIVLVSHNSEMDPVEPRPMNTVEITLNFPGHDESDENESSYDEEFPLGTEPTNSYDSKFESLDTDEFVKGLLALLGQNSPQVLSGFLARLNEKETRIINYIIGKHT